MPSASFCGGITHIVRAQGIVEMPKSGFKVFSSSENSEKKQRNMNMPLVMKISHDTDSFGRHYADNCLVLHRAANGYGYLGRIFVVSFNPFAFRASFLSCSLDDGFSVRCSFGTPHCSRCTPRNTDRPRVQEEGNTNSTPRSARDSLQATVQFFRRKEALVLALRAGVHN